MKEFAYKDSLNLNIPLSDEIYILNETESEEKFLVSNDENIDAEIYAPEINFYLQNSLDNVLEKSKNANLLYEIRALGYDYRQDLDFEVEVGNQVVLVGYEFMLLELKQSLEEEGLKVIILEASMIKNVSGSIGNLTIKINLNNSNHEILTNQIAWQNAPKFGFSGVINFIDTNEAREEILKNIGNFKYKNFISYDENICQHHHRANDTCGKCVDACPSVAIQKDIAKKELVFSLVDCIDCGKCVGVCPSGSIDYTQMPRLAFYEIAKLYKNKIPLLISKNANLCEIALKKDVLPFMIETISHLTEAQLLTLLQESSSSIIIYSDEISGAVVDSISMINQAYNIKFQTQAIYTCKNKNELDKALQKADFIQNSHFSINEEELKKREIFSARLSFLVDEKKAIISSGSLVEYARIEVNEKNCTLCLSCVGACNVGALVAFNEDNSLRVNSSICTSCGYCEYVCPESECLSVKKGEIELSKEYFGLKTLAKDELFACVVCGREFATKKSVEKIASIMKPIFKNDELKIKSLYCCANCKPKVMFSNIK